MQLRVAIAVLHSGLALRVSKAVLAYAIAENIEVDISYYHSIDSLNQNYLNLDILVADYSFLGQGKGMLGDLFRHNGECYPVIVDESENSLSEYLMLRPVAYVDIKNLDAVSDIYSRIVPLIQGSNQVLQLRTKQGVYAISVASILYCTSYQKYVSIITADRKEFRKIGKLDDYVQSLPPYMARVHQSYLVNTNYVTMLDKTSWELVLKDGERLPVSKAYRNAVSDYFQKCSFAG